MSLKVIELFAGIGSPRKALKNLNIDHEVVAFSEIDKYADEAYRAVHDDYETPNLGDIKDITHLPSCDLLTYGFPCQDISIAGYGQGIKEGTRSGLLIEVERLLDIASQRGNLPKYLILENVKALVQKKHRKDFDTWLDKLESLGYSNYWQVLNAKDYGIPQNRERVFVVSILGEHKPYEFPEKQELKLRLRDILEDEVSEKYYLKKEKVDIFLEKIKAEKIQGKIAIKTNTKLGYTYAENFDCIDLEYPKSKFRRGRIQKQISNTLKTGGNSGLILLGSLTDKNSQGERVYTTDLAVTLNANGGGLGAKTGLYMVVGGTQKNAFVGTGEHSSCLTSSMGTGGGYVPLILLGNINPNEKGADLKGYLEKSRKQLVTDCSLRIRRLTPNECWRLMGFSDEAYQKARIALNNKFYKGKDRANSQMYKQAGNSIVVNVLEAIFKNLFLEEETPVIQKLF